MFIETSESEREAITGLPCSTLHPRHKNFADQGGVARAVNEPRILHDFPIKSCLVAACAKKITPDNTIDRREHGRNVSWLHFPDGVRAPLPGHVHAARVSVSFGTCNDASSSSASFSSALHPGHRDFLVDRYKKIRSSCGEIFRNSLGVGSFVFQTKTSPESFLFRVPITWRIDRSQGYVDSAINNGAVTVLT